MPRHLEKRSNVLKKSSKRMQLRAEVKLRIKQRLCRDKAKEIKDNDNTGTLNPLLRNAA